MFRFTGQIVPRSSSERGVYMVEAQVRWPFLTHFDASTIKNERQLVTTVKERCSRSQQDAKADVGHWMRGKLF